MNNPYADYFMKAGDGSTRVVQISKNLLKVGGAKKFPFGRAARMKKLGLAVGSFALFELFATNAKAATNIYQHPPKAIAALDKFASNYETALDEATGDAGRVKHNTGILLKESFINYLKALELDEKVINDTDAVMGYYIDTKLKP